MFQILITVFFLCSWHCVLGSIFSVGSHKWVSDGRDSQLGQLPPPTVSVASHNHKFHSIPQLEKWITPIVANLEDRKKLMISLAESESMKRFKMLFWIDTLAASGRFTALLISKEEDENITILAGDASVSLPEVKRYWRDCEKVKRFMRSPFTRCHDRSAPRNLNGAEVALVSQHLSNALRSNPTIGPALRLAEVSNGHDL